MIVGMARLIVMALIGLTVVYFLVSVYSKSVRREKLEKEWDTDPAREDAPQADRTAFIEDGMNAYRHGLKRRLLWLIYIIPMIVFVSIIYYVNW
jgi:ABC-type Na+ efflux pump permease subunit